MLTEEFVSTSLARRMIARMQVTHERRRMSIFSGPPGIGKTTAVEAFQARQPNAVVIIKISRRDASEVHVMRHTIEALRTLFRPPGEKYASSVWELRTALFNAICEWAGADPRAAKRSEYLPATFPHLTIVFDEAQNLSRQAIDALRYWNDADRCYSPIPIGIIFVGNNEFSLRPSAAGHSTISEAVADRALHLQAYEYDDLTDDDLTLFIEARGLTNPSALAALLRYFRTPRSPRSLRRVGDLLADIFDAADGGGIDGHLVRSVLAVD
jgi:hypothetical protein